MADKLLLPEKTSELDKVQKGWLTFGHLKVTTFDALEKDELAIQQILNGYKDVTELKEIQDMIAKAKALAQESKERRLHLTNMFLEKVSRPSMEFEKRNDALISQANAHELTLRKEVVKKNEAESFKEREKFALKAHVENEYYRIAAKYKQDLEVMVLDSYKNALKNKTPNKEIKAYKKQIVEWLKEIKLDAFVKYECKHLSKEEKMAEFKSVKPYTGKDDLQAAIDTLEDTFAMYSEDLKNRTKAIKKTESKIDHVETETEKDIVVTTEINNMTAEAEPLTLSGGPTIKKKWEVVEENTADWALAVIGMFLGQLSKTREHIRVSSWSKLTIGQMAAACAKVGDPKLFPKLKFKEIEK
jgi:hypothetical protein